LDDLFKQIEGFINYPQESGKILEDSEAESLIISLAKSRGEGGFMEDEAVSLIKWAEGVRIASTLLNLALSELVSVNWDDAAKEPLFSITDEGIRQIKEFEGGIN